MMLMIIEILENKSAFGWLFDNIFSDNIFHQKFVFVMYMAW